MVDLDPALIQRIDDVRRHRDDTLEAIEAGTIDPASVPSIGADDPALASMKVLPMLEAIPGRKKVQTRRALGDIGVDEAALWSEVTREQWSSLPAALERHAR